MNITVTEALPELNEIANELGVKMNCGIVLKEYFARHLFLKIGDEFVQNFRTSKPLKFKILEIDHKKNTLRVECSHFSILSQTYSPWEEKWDDLNTVEQALEIGEYRLIKH